MTSASTEATSELNDLIQIRRELHKIPELRFAEFMTSAHLKALLLPIVDRVIDGVGGTGLLAIVDGMGPGPSVLLRADIDAYPVTEATGLAFAANTVGAAHACGHDVHMTVMVGVLARLAKLRPEAGSVHVLFQPAEEIPFGQASGARAALESGVLGEDYAAVLGLHCWPGMDAGGIGIDPEIAMAAKDSFRITVTGSSAHAATPSSGRDSILAISHLVTALHSTLSRRRNPDEMVAFNVGTIAGGASQSAVAPSASVTGTLRTHDEEVRARLKTTVEQLCSGIALHQDLEVELTWADEMPTLLNDSALVSLAHEMDDSAAAISELPTPPMTTDDFALLARCWPGLYVKLGVREPGAKDWPSLHSAEFTVDETCLITGVEAMEWLAREVLVRNAKD